MSIIVSEFENPDRIKSKHWVHTKTADSKDLITLTGIALVDWKGTGSSWAHETLDLQIYLPKHIIPNNKDLKIEQWAPLITISSIFNQNHAVNAGWAVDEFGLKTTQTSGLITLWANIAISDIDGWLYRVAYSITLLGTLIDRKVVID